MSFTVAKLMEVKAIGTDHNALYAAADIPDGQFLGFFDGKAAVADLGSDGRGAGLSDFFWRQSVHCAEKPTRFTTLFLRKNHVA